MAHFAKLKIPFSTNKNALTHKLISFTAISEPRNKTSTSLIIGKMHGA